MKRFSTLTVILVFFLGSTAMGFSWTTGYYNHGDTPFDHNNNTAPINYPYNVGYLPSPGPWGEGGEKFDLEGLFANFDDDYLYVAMTNSFGLSATSSEWGTTFRQGDIFFGLGGETNTFAIDISTGDLVSVNTWSYIQDQNGSYYNNEAIRDRVGAFEAAVSPSIGSANQVMTLWEEYETDPLLPDETSGNTYVFEWKLDRSLLNWDGEANIFFHTTLGCGNDLIEYNFGAIPEPTTVILLGLGLFGAGIMIRRN
jgi:hypothetical protein